jgi:hypothetical protein
LKIPADWLAAAWWWSGTGTPGRRTSRWPPGSRSAARPAGALGLSGPRREGGPRDRRTGRRRPSRRPEARSHRGGGRAFVMSADDVVAGWEGHPTLSRPRLARNNALPSNDPGTALTPAMRSSNPPGAGWCAAALTPVQTSIPDADPAAGSTEVGGGTGTGAGRCSAGSEAGSGANSGPGSETGSGTSDGPGGCTDGRAGSGAGGRPSMGSPMTLCWMSVVPR